MTIFYGGVDVKLNTNVNSSFNFKDYDIIYNTGEIDKFYNYVYGALEYRSLEFKTEFYNKKHFQDYAVINEADIEVPYTRTIEHKYFNDENQYGTIVTREYPRDYNGNNEPYYPVINNKNINLYNKYKELNDKERPNMIFCGRLGFYKYLDMDDAIREALEL